MLKTFERGMDRKNDSMMQQGGRYVLPCLFVFWDPKHNIPGPSVQWYRGTERANCDWKWRKI